MTTALAHIRYQRLIDRIDPSLVFVRDLSRDGPRMVFHVERGGHPYILKQFHEWDSWERKHLQRERYVLNQNPLLPGITHIVEDYGTIGQYTALLKEFAHGEDILQSGFPLSSQILSQISTTIHALHARGYANLEVIPRNIVVHQNNNTARIIDLGSCRLQHEVSPGRFHQMKKKDMHDFRQLKK